MPAICLKVCLVGDGLVGKSLLATAFVAGTKGSEVDYLPSHVGSITKDLHVDGKLYNLQFWDTVSRPSDDEDQAALLRSLQFSGSDVFIMCYAAHNIDTLNAVTGKYFPEIRDDAKGVPIILVGTQNDLCRGPGDVRLIDGLPRVDSKEVEQVQKAIGAVKSVYTSAMTGEGVDDLFDLVVREIVKNRQEATQSKSKCTIQ